MGKRLTWVDFVSHNIQRGDYDWAIFCLLLYTLFRGGMAQWVASLTNVLVVNSSRISKSQKLYPYCLVLVGSRNRFERDFTIELK